MDLFRRGELGLLGGGEGLRDDVGVSGISWSANRLPEDMYPASGLALAAAYHDIKTRLASLERENSSIKRKLKHYEVKVESSTYTNTQTIHKLSHRIEHKRIENTLSRCECIVYWRVNLLTCPLFSCPPVSYDQWIWRGEDTLLFLWAHHQGYQCYPIRDHQPTAEGQLSHSGGTL